MKVARAVELPVGTYNTTYRLEYDRREQPLILRVGPTPSASAEDDRLGEGGMRNAYAAAPYFAALDDLAPRTIGADFTRQIVDRDFVIQHTVPGIPATERLSAWTTAQRRSFYRQLGQVTRTVHSVQGRSFGLVCGPAFATWSDAVEAQIAGLRDAYAEQGLDPEELQRIVDAVSAHRSVLDEVRTPSLVHGDLWTLNLLVSAEADDPVITGVLDFDTARWGDPWSDWPIHQARVRVGTEADDFWAGYGASIARDDDQAMIRQLFYTARLTAGARLDIHRRNIDLNTVPPIHWDLAPLVRQLGV